MLRQSLLQLSVPTRGEGFVDLTADLNREISASGLDTGVAVLACLHTSCSLTINENADPRVLADLATYLRALARCRGFVAVGERVVVASDAPETPPGENCKALRVP